MNWLEKILSTQEGGHHVRPDWSGTPLPSPAATPTYNPDDPWRGYWQADGTYVPFAEAEQAPASTPSNPWIGDDGRLID